MVWNSRKCVHVLYSVQVHVHWIEKKYEDAFAKFQNSEKPIA